MRKYKKTAVSIVAALAFLAAVWSIPVKKGVAGNINTRKVHTTVQLSGITPDSNDLMIDSTKVTAVVGDGSTLGGVPLAREDGKYTTANWAITEYWTAYDEFATGSAFETSTVSYVITTTEAGAGDATEATQDANGGTLLITNDAADNDLDSIQTAQEILLLTASKKTVMGVKFKVSDATQSDVQVGWQIRDTTPFHGATTDGIYFTKPDGQTTFKYVAVMDSTVTSVTSAITAADNTYITAVIECDGTTSCTPYINGTAGTAITTNLPTDEELCTTLYLRNGEAVAKTMTVDYWFVQQER